MLVSNDAYRLDRIGGFGRRERLDAGTLGVVPVTVDRARDVPVLLAAEAVVRGHTGAVPALFGVLAGHPDR